MKWKGREHAQGCATKISPAWYERGKCRCKKTIQIEVGSCYSFLFKGFFFLDVGLEEWWQCVTQRSWGVRGSRSELPWDAWVCDSCCGSKSWWTAINCGISVSGFDTSQRLWWHRLIAGLRIVSSKAIWPSLMLQIPKALCRPSVPHQSLSFSPFIFLTISVYRSIPRRLRDHCPGREGTAESMKRLKERGREDRGGEKGGMSFTFVPQGRTHSSRAVHPVLLSPPLPRLTHHSARTHASNTYPPLLTMVPTLPPAYSPSPGNGDFLSFLFPLLLLVLVSCTTATTSLSSSIYLFIKLDNREHMVFISQASTLLRVFICHFPSCVITPNCICRAFAADRDIFAKQVKKQTRSFVCFFICKQ